MQEIIVIALIVLLLFGGKKIPELMKGLGKGVAVAVWRQEDSRAHERTGQGREELQGWYEGRRTLPQPLRRRGESER